MKRPVLLLVVGLLLVMGFTAEMALSGSRSPAQFPGENWTQIKASEQHGWSPEKLRRAELFAKRIGTAAVMVVEGGRVAVAWGPVDHRFPLHSIRKPLLSALFGIYVAQGVLDISRTLEALGIDDVAPELTAAEKKATVADLLTSRSGVYHPALGEVAAMKQVRPPRASHPPGTFWYYNNWDFNALGTIFERETGVRIFEAFEKRIAVPIQMQDFIGRDGTYITGAASVHRVYALRMSTRDLARFGLLYLRKGKWRGRQILPPEWVEASTTTHADIGRGRGYGYMWCTAVGSGLAPNINLPVRCFFHSGAGLHFLVVIPRLDLVLVHRVDTYTRGPYPSAQQIGRLFWMILDARGVADIGADPSLAGADAEPLPGDRLVGALTAHRLQILRPNNLVQGGDRHYRLDFEADGSMHLSAKGRENIRGRWHVSENRCCVDIDGLQSCFAVVDTEAAIHFYDDTGTRYATATKVR
jgi:CubicO group peptidase (beta-lactamase class C family)